MINPSKLINELLAADIHVIGCHSDGRVWDETGDIQDRPDIAAIIATHDPTETPQTEISFNLPIRAPTITISNIYIESPKPNEDPDLALAEAIAEAAKDGKKDLSLIVVSMLHYIDKKIKK